MFFRDAQPNMLPTGAARPRAWKDAVRVSAGILSLGAAVLVAGVLVPRAPADAQMRLLVGVLAIGLVAFAWGLLALGRSVANRWLAIGASVGFSPATRRPILDAGTDRPPLHGRVGRFSVRMRHVLMREPSGWREWIELEAILLAVPAHARVSTRGTRVQASDPQLEGRARRALGALDGVGEANISLSAGRLVMRVPLSEATLTHVVAMFPRVAESIEHPA